MFYSLLRKNMDKLINNPSLKIDIAQNITNLLDIESLQYCRLVSSSMKNVVDNPRFWLQKLDKKGLDKQHLTQWRKLVDLVEDTDLMGNVTKCLMKMYQHFSEWAQAPIHIASKAGDIDLVQMILEQIDDSMKPNKFGNGPIKLAAYRGFLEVVRMLMSYSENPNAPNKYGDTRNNRLRMGFYCVLTLSPDVPYLFLPKIGQKRQNWQFLGIFGDIHIQIWGHCEIW